MLLLMFILHILVFKLVKEISKLDISTRYDGAYFFTFESFGHLFSSCNNCCR